jgi:hypothetical protein
MSLHKADIRINNTTSAFILEKYSALIALVTNMNELENLDLRIDKLVNVGALSWPSRLELDKQRFRRGVELEKEFSVIETLNKIDSLASMEAAELLAEKVEQAWASTWMSYGEYMLLTDGINSKMEAFLGI